MLGGGEIKDCVVTLPWPDPQEVRQCMHFERIRMHRNVLQLFITKEYNYKL